MCISCKRELTLTHPFTDYSDQCIDCLISFLENYEEKGELDSYFKILLKNAKKWIFFKKNNIMIESE